MSCCPQGPVGDADTCPICVPVPQVVSLRGEVLSKHHELMSELRSLLKSLARQEDVAVQEYLSLYRGFSEQVSELVRTLLAAESPSEELAMALDSLAQLAPRVYSGLTALAGTQGESRDVSFLSLWTLKAPFSQYKCCAKQRAIQRKAHHSAAGVVLSTSFAVEAPLVNIQKFGETVSIA